jgi:hypothetical protein
VDERPVEEAERLVDYRFGQARFNGWLDALGPADARRRAIEAVRPVMEPAPPHRRVPVGPPPLRLGPQ